MSDSVWRSRLSSELARAERHGGFVSIALLAGSIGGEPGRRLIRGAVGRLGAHLRGYDSVGIHEDYAAVLMPETDMSQASLVAKRLLAASLHDVGAPVLDRGGVASAFGPVEGGAEALIDAAQQAVVRAVPGEVATSTVFTGRPRILVVDDDRAYATVFAELLEARGWDADPCTEVIDAEARIRGFDYHGYFFDVALGARQSGFDLLRLAMGRTPPPPVVLMSGKDAERDVLLDALSLGPVMFVRKPLSSQDLGTALDMFRSLLSGSRDAGGRRVTAS